MGNEHIDGFKTRIYSDEMRKHFKARITHHEQAASDLEGKYSKVKEKFVSNQTDAVKELQALGIGHHTMGMMPGFPGNDAGAAAEHMLQGIKSAIEGHKARAQAFAFFESHLIDGYYDLYARDVQGLEFINTRTHGIGLMADYIPEAF